MSYYLPFIKTLYEGANLKSLPLYSQNENLYRGSILSNKEIEEILSIKNKIDDLPTNVVFSKAFLSFHKDLDITLELLYQTFHNKNFNKVLFVIERRGKNSEIEYNLETNADLEEISYFPDENEVLFFPFSSLEIKNVEETFIMDVNVYKITLNYLGKYLKEFKKI